MDSFTHMVVGAALCSRTGLAGGRRGAFGRDGVPRLLDWTFYAALLFGGFPDGASLGIHLIPRFFMEDHAMWHSIPPYIFTLYRMTHSLVIALACVLLVRAIFRPLWIPMLAWPLHILTDVFTHGPGRFQTPIFFPIATFKFQGVNWWEHPAISYTAWMVAALLWMGILSYRYVGLQRAGRHGPLSASSEKSADRSLP